MQTEKDGAQGEDQEVVRPTGHSLNNNVAGDGRNELITLPDEPSTQCGHDVWRGTQLLEMS